MPSLQIKQIVQSRKLNKIDMDITFAIVRAENADYLCHHANGIYVDVSNPMRTFVAGEDKFRLIELTARWNGRSTGSEDRIKYLVPRFMPTGGWLFCCRVWRMKVSISSFLSIWRK